MVQEEPSGGKRSPYFTDEEDRRYLQDRLIFFSDAVVAIAITLLALDLPVPHGKTNAQVWHSFLELLPKEYLNFLVGFAVIAFFWWNHHRFFRGVYVVSPKLLRLNILWLFFIAVSPFATRLDSEDSAFVLGPVFFAVVIAALALVLAAMAAHAARAGLNRPGLPRSATRSVIVGGLTAAGVFLLSIPVSFINPSWGRYVWLSLVVVSSVADHLTERRAHPVG
ncbi:TMEM175 family protein [Amycolatopsis sp. NPDC059021]|uniref:TMEM175 family protein n=1 Tax=Amycolatopsis sp. NPDC059021 TaxID=3346704 RepID=UPI003670728B